MNDENMKRWKHENRKRSTVCGTSWSLIMIPCIMLHRRVVYTTTIILPI